MAGPISSLIGLGSGLIQSSQNAANVRAANAQTEQFQLDMYNRQRSDALADRAFANDYNSPAAQMDRLRSAGLNPNLVYGQGSVAQPSQPVRSSEGGSFKATPVPPSIPDVSGLVMGFLDVVAKMAQTDNVKANTELAKQAAATSAATEASTEWQTTKSKSLFPIDADAARANLQKVLTDTKVSLDANERAAAMNTINLRQGMENIFRTQLENANTAAEYNNIKARLDNLQKDAELKQLDINLKQLGIQPGDSAWMRILAQLAQGKTAGSIIEGIKSIKPPTIEFSNKDAMDSGLLKDSTAPKVPSWKLW